MTAQALSPHIYEMMARLGIDLGAVDSLRSDLRYATAIRRCETCRFKTECQEWLDQAPLAVSFAPWFCINADILFELQCDQPGPRRMITESANIADLERLEGEIEEALIDQISKSADDSTIVGLRRRKLHLKNKIEWLRHRGVAVARNDELTAAT
ncbi:MAG TPA: DUF6455 family protein [Xanthobacteraceae bacterium]|nr:DUF6455 family protein [Xanthobacteraceae bacterium]